MVQISASFFTHRRCTSLKKTKSIDLVFFLVRETGLEPVRDYHTPLKRARLPIPPLSHFAWNSRNYITAKHKCQALFSNIYSFNKKFFEVYLMLQIAPLISVYTLRNTHKPTDYIYLQNFQRFRRDKE